MSTPARRRPPRPRRTRLPASLRTLGDDRGGTALEMAICAPAVLLLLYAALQVCLLSYARSCAVRKFGHGGGRAICPLWDR